jgi:hypothetical protein
MSNWDWGYFRFLVDLARRENAWILTAILFGACLFALGKNYLLDKSPFHNRHLLTLFPFLFPVLLLIWGSLFEHTKTTDTSVPEWQLLVPNALLVLQLLINLTCFYAFTGVRLSVLALALMQAYLTLFTWLIATMSIRNEWL